MSKKIMLLISLVILLTACSNESKVADESNVPPLFKAVRDKDTAKVYELAKGNPELINELYQGESALHAAVFSGEIEIIQSLVEAGADITLKNESGESPFFVAADLANVKAIHYFLDKGANPNEVNLVGDTPLMKFAARGGIPIDVFLEVLDRMIDEDADLTIKNNQGDTFYSMVKPMLETQNSVNEIEKRLGGVQSDEIKVLDTLVNHPDSSAYRTIYGDIIGCPNSGVGAMVVSIDGVVHAINGIAIGYYKNLPAYTGEHFDEYVSACKKGLEETKLDPVIEP
ncbi:hypothetical protein ABID47_001534 [Paenibacillus favisporus]|uniref:Ankyrin repeat domain-containing protein n=1 Tax=Paenibacillus favisporus TaxID=221028 RepID=A0ABV2EZK5_9BACL